MPSPTTVRYDWSDRAPMARLDLREQSNGRTVAYLYANENQPADALKSFRMSLHAQGWATSPHTRGGKAVLRISGLQDGASLLALLKDQQQVDGDGMQSSIANDNDAPEGFLGGVRAQSLRASGLFYALGDVLFLYSGYARSKEKGAIDYGQIGTGASFLAGDTLLSIFGGRDDARQFRSLLSKLETHLENKGIAVPDRHALHAETLARKGGLLETIYDFLHDNINVLKMLAEIIGGASYIKAGFTQNNDAKKVAGSIIVTGWLAALLIKEKKPDPEKLADAGLVEKAIAYVQEKPLRLAGGAGLIHNGISTYGAFDERHRFKNPGQFPDKAGSKHYAVDLAGICAMLFGNSLYAISNKSAGGSIRTDALIDDVYGMAAQVLSAQPEALREQAIATTAQFLGERSEIKDTHAQITARLRDELARLEQNPWYQQAPITTPVLGR